MNIKPIVLVPLYKNFIQLNKTEIVSLERLVSVLQQYQIGLFGPNEMNWEPYIEFFSSHNINCNITEFSKVYFADIPGYNKLMLCKSFYETYQQYSHILIYQTDAYVFEDQLEYWCSLDYDYIGAPWKEETEEVRNPEYFTGVGNGGFSLRKTSAFINVLNSKKPFKTFNQLWFEYRKYSLSAKMLKVPYMLTRAVMGWRNNGGYYAERFKDNEDLFWGIEAPASLYLFKIPKIETAMQFAFEVEPEVLFEQNQQRLPFGCHAWLKYNATFWRQFISW